MNTTPFRSIGTIAGAAAIAITATFAGSTAPANAGQHDTAEDRPCFMIQSHWNNAEGPQPTCPTPMWPQLASSSDKTDGSRPSPQARIPDFMP